MYDDPVQTRGSYPLVWTRRSTLSPEGLRYGWLTHAATYLQAKIGTIMKRRGSIGELVTDSSLRQKPAEAPNIRAKPVITLCAQSFTQNAAGTGWLKRERPEPQGMRRPTGLQHRSEVHAYGLSIALVGHFVLTK